MFGRLAVAVSVVAAAAVFLLFATGQYGASNDTFTYVSTAANVASGDGYRAADGHVPTEFAPLYVLVLAAMLWAHIDPAIALGVVNTAAIVALLTVTWRWVSERETPAWSLAAVVGVAAGAPVVAVFSYGWSEPLFLVFASGALWLTDRALRRPASWRLTVSVGVMVAAGCLTRYAGGILLGAVVLAFVLRRRWASAIVVAITGAGPISVWVVRNALLDQPAAGARGPATLTLADSIGQGLGVAGKWVIGPLPAVLTAIVAVGLVAIVVLFDKQSRRLAVLGDPAVIFVVLYFIGIVALAGGVTGISPPNDRLLAPLFPPLVVLLIGRAAPGWSLWPKRAVLVWLSAVLLSAMVLGLVHVTAGVDGPVHADRVADLAP